MPDPAGIAAIVLAAGASRRFGTDKLLHSLTRDGAARPLAAHSLLPWLQAFDTVTVVVKPQAEAFCSTIEAALGEHLASAISWAVCEDAAEGMAASLRCGIRANCDAAGWLIGLADMPALPAPAIAGVRDALINGAAIAAAVRAGRRGHPVGFASRYCGELLDLQGDAGARSLLERNAAHVTLVEIEHNGIFTDIDHPIDLGQLNP